MSQGSGGARGNLSSALPRRRRSADPMAEHDRLPAPARLWVCHAALPWSARSVARIWRRSHAQGGTAAALAALAAAEARMLARDPFGAALDPAHMRHEP